VRVGLALKITQSSNQNPIRATLDCIAQTFKLADKPDPRLDRENKFAFFLQCELRNYSNIDKPVTPQAAATGSILQEFYKLSISSYQIKLFVSYSLEHSFLQCALVNMSRSQDTENKNY